MRKSAVLFTAVIASYMMWGCDSGTNPTGGDSLKSSIRIDVQRVTQNGAVITPLAAKTLVGILRRGIDSTVIQKKAGPVFADSVSLTFDSLVPVGSSVIIDCFADANGNNTYDPPAVPTSPWTTWPEPSFRWVLDSVAQDDKGGHGVQLGIAIWPYHAINDITK